MKNQIKTKKKKWTTPSVKGQLSIKGTLGGQPFSTRDAGGMDGGS